MLDDDIEKDDLKCCGNCFYYTQDRRCKNLKNKKKTDRVRGNWVCKRWEYDSIDYGLRETITQEEYSDETDR